MACVASAANGTARLKQLQIPAQKGKNKAAGNRQEEELPNMQWSEHRHVLHLLPKTNHTHQVAPTRAQGATRKSCVAHKLLTAAGCGGQLLLLL
jgi:hypothetical protein